MNMGLRWAADPGNEIVVQALLFVSELRLPFSPTGRGRLRSQTCLGISSPNPILRFALAFRSFQDSPRHLTTCLSITAMSATASMATAESSTMGANTPAPSSWVIILREK